MTRLIPLEGGYNFRDIGGYPTRNGQQTVKGRIYRSGSLHQLTDADLQTLTRLGIRSVFDLREENEYEREGVDRLTPEMQYIPMPTSLGRLKMIDKLQSDPLSFRMVDFYLGSLDERLTYHANLFRRILGEVGSPLVIHCSAGKDRTGVIVALLLRVAGVPDETIVADYTETENHLVDYHQRQSQTFRGFGLPDAAIQEMLAAKAETITATLAYLDQHYGSAEDYLLQGGATSAEIDHFRRQFLA